jgi:hypothetical protein
VALYKSQQDYNYNERTPKATLDLVEIVEAAGFPLRRQGREFVGLCPFHAEKTPSFNVSPEKNQFHCFGCLEGGDSIRFVERRYGVDFKRALEILGLKLADFPPPVIDPIRRRVATKLADWLNSQFLKLGMLLRELSRDIALAQKIPDPQLAQSLTDEWEILGVLHDDLQEPTLAVELWGHRDSIELVTDQALPEPIESFPSITAHSHRPGAFSC